MQREMAEKETNNSVDEELQEGESRGVFSEARPQNRFYETLNQTFFSRISQKRGAEEERDPIFGDFILKIVGTLDHKGQLYWVCTCRGLTVKHPIKVLER
eukprot:Seg5369.2 transcript_id=Seg5369.2/GoldUCD/mRNA.D3Y31 product="hypothetical protein" protein_id=Seg5369.2/GoldUCD/D3Y31